MNASAMSVRTTRRTTTPSGRTSARRCGRRITARRSPGISRARRKGLSSSCSIAAMHHSRLHRRQRTRYAEGSASTPVACVEDWYVNEDVHRGGGGARPMAAVELWARNRGLRELASDGELGNHASIAAHATLGSSRSSKSCAGASPSPERMRSRTAWCWSCNRLLMT